MNKIELCAVGGYGIMGRNMTAVRYGDDAVILDMGIHLDNYIAVTEDDDSFVPSAAQLLAEEAVPNINAIKDWTAKVRAIIPSHAHLDHIGAIPYIASKFPDAEITSSPYTIAVIKAILRDNKISLPNSIRPAPFNTCYTISKDIKAELINVTHSVPQSAMIALHTPAGIILYATDFKFDLHPTLDSRTNTKRIKELGKKGVLALIVDSTYSRTAGRMPSELIAREMLHDVLLSGNAKNNLIVVTTFSSHIARLKSILEVAQKMRRKVLFLGRSLSKYIEAAQEIKLVDFSSKAEIKRYSSQIRKTLRKIPNNKRSKYLLIMTGHQGEPKATLSKVVNERLDFRLLPGDHVIFSCKTIPTPLNIRNRDALERSLHRLGVHVFKDVHVSGHAAREDIRELIELVRPQHIIPAHGFDKMLGGVSDLAQEMGYRKGKDIHILKEGERITLQTSY